MYKYETKTITIASGTPTGAHNDERHGLPNSYSRLVGLYIPKGTTFTPELQLGVKDNTQTYQDLTDIRDYVSTVDVPQESRMKDFDIEAGGNTIVFNWKYVGTAPLAAAVSFDVVMKLVK